MVVPRRIRQRANQCLLKFLRKSAHQDANRKAMQTRLSDCCKNVVVDWYRERDDSHQNRSGYKRRTRQIRNCWDEMVDRRTLDKASRARGFRPCTELPTNNRSESYCGYWRREFFAPRRSSIESSSSRGDNPQPTVQSI